MRPAQGMWTSSCADNQRRPLVFDKVSLRRADGIAVDAASADLTSPTSLDGVVDANHHGGVGADEGGDQQAQQPACHGAGRPHSLVEHTMIDREVVLLLPPKNTQCRRDGSLARRQDGACHQQQDVLPGRAGEQPGQAGEPRQQAFRQGDSSGGGMGSWCCIPCVELTRPNRSKLRLVSRTGCGQTGRHDGS